MNQTNVIQLPDAIQWAEGMLLTPQHFQQNDIYWNAILLQRLRGLNAYQWGILDLQLDMPLLATRSVDIKRLNCIFPDGTPFILNSDSAKPLRLSIKPEDLANGKSVRVCLAMPPRTGAMNIQSTSIKRYENVPPGNPVIDEMTGFANVFVDRIRPTVELYLEQNVPAGYQAIHLLEVSHNTQSAQLELTDFHPPMLRLGAAAFMSGAHGLMQALHQLRDQLWDKMHKLTGMVQTDKPDRVAAMSDDERIQLGLARHIASALPMFDAVILDAETSPAHAYRALAHVVGSMAWIGSNPAPLVMPPYTHENCAPQFFAAIDYVLRKLTLINTDWESLTFNHLGELSFMRRLPEDASTSLLVEVRLREGQSLRDVQAWLSDSRIGRHDLMQALRQRRLSGASWSILSSTDVSTMGLRSDAIIVRLESQKIEDAKLGMVDCFGPGHSLLIQSNNAQLMPAAVILQHPRSGDKSSIDYQPPEVEAVHA